MEGIVSGYDSPGITVYILASATSGSGAIAQEHIVTARTAPHRLASSLLQTRDSRVFGDSASGLLDPGSDLTDDGQHRPPLRR